MRNRLIILFAGLAIGGVCLWAFGPPQVSIEQTPLPSTDENEAGEPQPETPAPEEDATASTGLVPPLEIPGITPVSANSKRPLLHNLVGVSLPGEFVHDNDAHFHPHGEQVCASGCATSSHPTETLTEQEFHRLLAEFSTQPWNENSPAYEALLYYGRQAREMLNLHGAGPLDPLREGMLREELMKTHARVSIRVVDEHGEIRSHIEPTLVPLDRRHVFDMKANRVQPLVTSGTVKRVGLYHIWARL